VLFENENGCYDLPVVDFAPLVELNVLIRQLPLILIEAQASPSACRRLEITTTTGGRMPPSLAHWPPSRRSGALARREGGKCAATVEAGIFACQ